MLTSPLNIGLTYGLDPISSSWFQVWFQGPGGQMPEAHTVHVANIPDLGDSIQAFEAPLVNRTVRIPGGFAPMGAIQISMRMLTDQRCFNFWNAWYNTCYDRQEDSVPIATEIMGTGVITIHDNAGPIREIELIDIWPSAVRVGGFSNDEDQLMSWVLILEVNDVNHR